MPSLTKTTRSKPKLQLQLQATATTATAAVSNNSTPSSSPPLSPNILLISSPPAKKFQLKNLRRITSQANLQRSISARSSTTGTGLDGNDDLEYPHSNLHSSIASGNSLDVFELQARIAVLTRSLTDAQENLKIVDTERQLWKRKARIAQETLKEAVEKSEALGRRCAELQEDDIMLRERIDNLEAAEQSREDALKQENEQMRRRIRELERRNSEKRLSRGEVSEVSRKKTEDSCVDQTSVVRALVTHHWNSQAEMATNVGRERDWCGCVAARTVKALLKDGSTGAPSVLKSEDKIYTSPTRSGYSSDERGSALKLHLPPHPHPEIFDEARRKRKEALKRKVHEMRGYVEDLRRENDALETLLDGEPRH